MVQLRSAITVIIIGIALWFIALIVAFGIDASSNAKWICAFGITLGIIGLRYTISRAKRESN
jgi:predicted exporter